MITELLVDIGVGLLVSVLGAVMPDFDTAIPDLSGVFTGMLTLNAFLPLSETLAAAVAMMGLQSGMFVLKLAQTIVAHVPWIGGGGA